MSALPTINPGLDADDVEALLRRAYNLGQTYFSQADSDSYRQNALSDHTAAKFEALVKEGRAAAAVTPPGCAALACANRIGVLSADLE